MQNEIDKKVYTFRKVMRPLSFLFIFFFSFLFCSTPYSLCEVYHNKSREKICGLRSDTLAQLVSQGSLCPGRVVLVVDGVVGLLAGTAAYRMRGFGRILAVYTGQQPHFELVAALNLDQSSTSIIQV